MDAQVARAAAVVRAGGVLVYPTETVYGIGCDPADAAAVARIRALKGRDAAKPMLAVTDAWHRVEGWIAGVTDAHGRLMAHEPPLALTLVFAAAEAAPPALVSPEGTVALRRTPDPFCRALVAAAGTAVLSTSANRAGLPPAHRFDDLDPTVRDAADLAVDAGRPLGGTPSTVARVAASGRLEVLREGAVDRATLERIAAG
ncbi:MAG: L-threonylcarbamoyladenylate synthase [Rhodothermales bacterium]|nr:L-threonylcarbamoyladenylate synthase [Rhodothermales bacterium]